ncbi:MAG: DUF1565 domain-containing protein [Sandaracinaceae bacterium]
MQDGARCLSAPRPGGGRCALHPSACCISLLLLVLAVGCDGTTATDGGVDAGSDAGMSDPGRAEPMPPVWDCPDGWTSVDRGGVQVCDPGPSSECEAGHANFLGEDGCTPVGGACPTGDFADDLPTTGVRYVQPGGRGDGTRGAPFGTIAQALSGAPAGTVVALAKGVYDERITALSNVHVSGACAAETVLRGRGSEGSVIDVQPSITGAIVSGLSIRPANQVGVFVVGELTLRGVAIEGAELFGVLVGGGHLDAEDLLVRGTELGSGGDSGVGVVVSEASASLRRVILEHNHQAELLALSGAMVTVEDLAARSPRVGELPDTASGLVAEGAELTGRRVLVEDTRAGGVVSTVGGQITLEDAVVRRCRAEGARMGFGVASRGGAVALSRAWITDAQGTALQTSEGGSAELTDVVIDAVVPPPDRPDWGVGLSVAERGTINVSRVWIADTAAAGVTVIGQEGGPAAEARIAGSDVSIRDVADLGLSGVGVYLATQAEAELSRVAIERTSHAGIVVNGASLRLTDVRVTDTTFNLDDGADLYLACACVEGVRGAADAFERAVMPAVKDAIRRVDRDANFVDEVAADVRVKLLVATASRPPRIARYLGRGPLTAFAQVVGMRTAQSVKRRRGHEDARDPDSLLDLALGPDDPELNRLLDEVRGPFRVAFRESLSELTSRQRNVLRLYLLEDVSSETIGTMYSVHRATVARWITEARAAVLKGTKKRLMQGLQMGDASVASLIGRLQTQLDISLAGFLAH